MCVSVYACVCVCARKGSCDLAMAWADPGVNFGKTRARGKCGSAARWGGGGVRSRGPARVPQSIPLPGPRAPEPAHPARPPPLTVAEVTMASV